MTYGITEKPITGSNMSWLQEVHDNSLNANPKKRTLHFVVENYVNGERSVPSFDRWFNQQSLMKKLYFDVNFKSFSSHQQLKKEMTEASAQVKMFEWLSTHDNHHNSLFQTGGKNYIIIDICSGKGFFGVLISHILQHANVILIDKNSRMNLQHLASCPNLEFECLDILQQEFSLSDWIRNKFHETTQHPLNSTTASNQRQRPGLPPETGTNSFNQPAPKTFNTSATANIEKIDADSEDNNTNSPDGNPEDYKLVLVGTHLCGELSSIVINAFNLLPEIASALFLVPCCYPRQSKIISQANELKMDPMQYWLATLQDQLKTNSDHPGHRKRDLFVECIQMQEILSDKNWLIRCCQTTVPPRQVDEARKFI